MSEKRYRYLIESVQPIDWYEVESDIVKNYSSQEIPAGAVPLTREQVKRLLFLMLDDHEAAMSEFWEIFGPEVGLFK